MKLNSLKLIAFAFILFSMCAFHTGALSQQVTPLSSERFNDPSAAVKHLDIDQNQWRVESGVLKTRANNLGSVSLRLSPDVSDFSIEFDARIIKVNDSGHFGIDLRTSSVEGKSSNGKIYCWPSGALGYQESVPNGAGRNIGPGAVPKPPVIGVDTPFIHFRYVCVGKLIHLYADGQFIATIDAVAPDRGALTLYSYNLDIEVDNINITPINTNLTADSGNSSSAASTADDIHISFDAVSSTGSADSASQAFYGDGLTGTALYLGTQPAGASVAAPTPIVAVKAPFSKGASIVFWMKTEFDFWAPQGHRLGDILSIVDSSGKPVIRLSLNDWSVRGEVKDRYTDALFTIENRSVGYIGRNEWHHIAMVVEPNGPSKLYLDGMLYSASDISMSFSGIGAPEPRMSFKKNAADISGAETIIIGSADKSPRDCALDDVAILPRALTHDQVADAFRQGMPVDMVIERKFIRANKDELLSVEVHPAGTLPCSPGTAQPSVKGTVKLTLQPENGSTPALTVTKQVTVSRKFVEVVLPVKAVPEGYYRLTCQNDIGGVNNTRTFPIYAYTQNTPVATTKGVKERQVVSIKAAADMAGLLKSGPVTTRTLKGGTPYLEVGDHKMDRVSFPINIPQQYRNGRPMILEITWPDDKIRSMGLYLYPKSAWANDRDRLEGGIVAGGIYPNTGEMKTVRYVIYPWVDTYLFEARTMVPGRPAAVASVRLLTAASPLPKANFAVQPPAAHRMIGHVDEDQSFDYLTGSFRDLPLGSGLTDLVDATQKMVDYFDYTGQDVLAYPVLRYGGAQYALPGSSYSRHGLLSGYGVPALMMDMLAARGKKYIAIANLFHLPELAGPSDRWSEFEQKGYFMSDRNGKTVNTPNPVHPAVRSMVLKHVSEVVRRLSKSPAFAGLSVWHLPIQFSSLEHGYDDYSVGLFEKETGIKVPSSKGADRFAERYAFLTSTKRREWLAWRAGKVTSAFNELAALVSAAKKDCRTYLSIVQPEDRLLVGSESETLDAASYYYEQFGFDLAQLGKRSDMVISPLRRWNMSDWKKAWDNSYTLDDEFLYSNQFGSLFRQSAKEMLTSSFNLYFESFNGSLNDDVYKSMFQNADVKPNGRHILRELAFNLAASDPSIIMMGGQPLGSAGRDDEFREFATAFRALPSKPFQDIAGQNDPICARHAKTSDGLYIYAVNRIWTNGTVTITFNKKIGSVVDQSSGKKTDIASNKLTLQLKPYQLKSFKISSGAVPVSMSCHVDAATTSWYRARAKAVAADVQKLTSKGIAIPALATRLKAISTAVETGRLAEAHRLLFSKMIDGEMPKLSAAAETGYLSKQADMIRTSRYAINCGADSYYTAKDGTLFFPDDRSFSPGGYGYIGKRSGVTRDVNALRNVDDPKLFETEAYDVEGYKFTVKPGKYTVKLYLRVGYPPSQKAGVCILDYTIAGQKLLNAADIYTLCGDSAANVAIQTFKGIEVKGDTLDISCVQKDGVDPSARLFNAIEVIPE